MQVVMEGREQQVTEGASCAETLKAALSGKKFKSVVACKVDGRLVDLSFPLAPGVREVEAVYAGSPEYSDVVMFNPAINFAAILALTVICLIIGTFFFSRSQKNQ